MRPKYPTLGSGVAGVVVAVGSSVVHVCVGDRIFGGPIRSPHWTIGGASAEYAVAPETGLALMPDNLAFEQAAAVPTSALRSLSGLCDQGKIQQRQHVLINGAGGKGVRLLLPLLRPGVRTVG